MIEPLSIIHHQDMMMTAREQCVQKERVDVLFKFTAVQLHTKLITEYNGDREGVILIVDVVKFLGNTDYLFK